MNKKRLLAMVAARPETSMRELRKHFPEATTHLIRLCLTELIEDGAIERCGYGIFCIAQPPEPTPSRPSSSEKASSSIQPPSRERLMGRR